MGVSPARRRPPAAPLIDRARAGSAPSPAEFCDLEARLIEFSRGANAPEPNGSPALSNAVSLRVEPELVLALQQALALAPGVKAAFVHGSVAKGEQSPANEIELMMIVDGTKVNCFGGLRHAEKLLKRRVRANLVSEQEWRRELREGNPFFTTINAQPRIVIFASADDLLG